MASKLPKHFFVEFDDLIEKAEIISNKLDPYNEFTVISKEETFDTKNAGIINMQVKEEYREYFDWIKEVHNSSLIDYLPKNFFKGERINIYRSPRSYKKYSTSDDLDDWRKEKELIKKENIDYLERIESELKWQIGELRRIKDELLFKLETTPINNIAEQITNLTIKDGYGFFKIGEKNINLGRTENIPYKLLEALSPFGIIKRIDTIFMVTNPKIGKYSKDRSLNIPMKKLLLNNRLKELQRILKKEKFHVSLVFDNYKETVSMKYKSG